ncbi:MAG: hypothetical protein AAGN82_05705 [Myxococcota bacterium]
MQHRWPAAVAVALAAYLDVASALAQEEAQEEAESPSGDRDALASPVNGTEAPTPSPSDDEDFDWGDDDDDDDDVASLEPRLPRLSAEERRARRRRRSAQSALEAAEPRPPLDDVIAPAAPPWNRRLEVGGVAAVVVRPFADAVVPNTGISYRAAPAWGVVFRWALYDWVAVHPYFLDSHHALGIPQGAFATGAANSIAPDATYETDSVITFSFGAKLAPTWEVTPRLRLWGSFGVGWGRFEFRSLALEEGTTTFSVNERDSVFIEFPIGLGLSYDVIDRWLAVGYEATGAPVTGQTGTAHEAVQAVDGDGNLRDVGPVGAIEASFVQSLSLTVIL